MSKHRTSRYRPSLFDSLEDRAVPSAAPSIAQVSAAAAGPAADTTALNIRLNLIGTQVNAAYSAFATSVRQAETSLLAPAGATATAPPATAAAVTTQLTQQVGTLSTALAAAINGTRIAKLPDQAHAIGLIQSGLNGPDGLAGSTNGSLVGELATLLTAASSGTSDGTASQPTLPLLFAAVEGAISSSYESTAVQIFLFESAQISSISTGNSTGGTGSTTATGPTGLDATRFGTQVNGAYSTFATAIRQAEVTLIGTVTGTGGPATAPATAASVSTTALGQIATLSQSLGTALLGTTGSSSTALIQSRFLPTGGPGSLSNVISTLFTAAANGSADGTVARSALPLLFAAVEGAISTSYTATAIDGYFLATTTTAS